MHSLPPSPSPNRIPLTVQRALLFAGVILTSGCYAYMPSPVDTLEAGQSVRLRLSPEEADRLEPLRMTDMRILEGIVFLRSADGILVDTSVGRLDPQLGLRPMNQRLDVSLREIREAELRQRDNLKTGLAIGAAGIAAGLVVAAVVSGGGGNPRDPGDGGPAESWLPVLLRFSPVR